MIHSENTGSKILRPLKAFLKNALKYTLSLNLRMEKKKKYASLLQKQKSLQCKRNYMPNMYYPWGFMASNLTYDNTVNIIQ